MFASQMNATQASVLSTVQYSYTYYTNIVDTNGNHVADANRIEAAGRRSGPAAAASAGLTPPSSTPNVIGNYKTPLTHEWTAGFDHQVARDFASGGTFTYRRYTDFDWYHLIGVNGNNFTTSSSYACTAAQAAILGTSCSVPVYTQTVAGPANGGKVYEVRPDYHQNYWGIELNGTKRLSHNWMARASFTTGRTTETIGGNTANLDPTPMAFANTGGTDLGPDQSGGDVSTKTAGSGKSNIFLIAPQYQFIANSTYQIKYGINFGVNYLLRQGYAEPYFTSAVGVGKRANTDGLLLVSASSYPHLPAVNSLDARIGKTLKMHGHTEVNLDMDIFNLLNLNTVLGRQYDLATAGVAGSSANQVLEIMNPRIIRFGVRISF